MYNPTLCSITRSVGITFPEKATFNTCDRDEFSAVNHNKVDQI